jgi:hypothetical protein
VCEQEHLRNSALTAGKQLKGTAPLRAKTTSTRGLRHLWPFIDYRRETEVGARRSSPCGFRTQKTFAIADEREEELRVIGCTPPHNNAVCFLRA